MTRARRGRASARARRARGGARRRRRGEPDARRRRRAAARAARRRRRRPPAAVRRRRLVSRRRPGLLLRALRRSRSGPTRSGRRTRTSSGAATAARPGARVPNLHGRARRLPRRLVRPEGPEPHHPRQRRRPLRDRGTKARRGGTSPTCRSRSSTACRWTTRSRSTTCAAARRTTARCAARAGRMNRVGIRTSDWYTSGGGDGFQTRSDPDDPNIVYATSQNGAHHAARPAHRPVARASGRAREQRAARRRAAAPARRRAGAAARRRRRAHELGRALHRQPALADAALLGQQRLYRTDDRGDSWTRDQRRPDAQSRPGRDPDHGQGVGSGRRPCRCNHATTALSNIVSLDESPLLEGLLYVGTDDGTAAGDARTAARPGARSRRSPACRTGTYVTDVFASPRDVERRVRHAEQLAARRLQAVPAEEHRPRPDVQVDRRRPAGPRIRCGRSSRTTSTAT